MSSSPGPLEHQAGKLLLQGFVDFLEHLAGGGKGAGEVASHTDGLAALAREDEGVNRHCENPQWAWRDAVALGHKTVNGGGRVHTETTKDATEFH